MRKIKLAKRSGLMVVVLAKSWMFWLLFDDMWPISGGLCSGFDGRFFLVGMVVVTIG